MKYLTVLIYTILLTVTAQVATAQTSGRGIEALIMLATVSNVTGNIKKMSYPLPTGKIRTIYVFNPKKHGREPISQTTRRQ